MSPKEVKNLELYHDRTVQDWHRKRFPHDWYAIDLDLMGYCKKCGEPLYLIESTTNPEKVTRAVHHLAARAEIAALCIMHNREHKVTGGHIIYVPGKPDNQDELQDEDHVARSLMAIRAHHCCRP